MSDARCEARASTAYLPLCSHGGHLTAAHTLAGRSQAVVYDGYNFYLKSASEPRSYREGYSVMITEPTTYELKTNCTP